MVRARVTANCRPCWGVQEAERHPPCLDRSRLGGNKAEKAYTPANWEMPCLDFYNQCLHLAKKGGYHAVIL